MTREIFFFENHAENEAGRLFPEVFLFFFKKTSYEVKASGLQFSFNIVIALILEYNQNKMYETLD